MIFNRCLVYDTEPAAPNQPKSHRGVLLPRGKPVRWGSIIVIMAGLRPLLVL